MPHKLIGDDDVHFKTIFSQKVPSSHINCTQPIDELNVTGNVVIHGANPDTLVVSSHATPSVNLQTLNYSDQIEDPLALATSTPLAKKFIPVDNSLHVMTEHERNVTVQEIASHLSALDDSTLVHLQEIIAHKRLPKEGNNIPTEAKLDTFFPVGTITCNYVNCNSPSDCEQKADISMKANNEQVFDIPDSMVAYIYNKTTQNVVKVKLIPENEDIPRYVPVQTNGEEIPTPNSKAPCTDARAVSQGNDTLPFPRPKLLSTSKGPTKKSVQKNKFRRITAKWKNVRNRSLHAKFIPKCSPVIQKPSDIKKKKNSGRKHHITFNEDPDYKPTTKIQDDTGIFHSHYFF